MTAASLPELVQDSIPQQQQADSSAVAWLKRQHPEYQANVPKWIFARDNYTGELLDWKKITDYLQQRRQGEGNEAFKERARCADYSNHFAVVVDSMAGMLTAVQGDTNRTWGMSEELADGSTKVMGLGDPTDQESEAYRLSHDVDGNGAKNDSFWTEVAIELSITHTGWLFVDPQDGDAVYKYIVPEQVPNWFYDADDNLVEVLIQETADARTSMKDKATTARQYLYLTIEGWERWRLHRNGKTASMLDSGTWSFEDEKGQAVLPIRQVKLPMKRQSGWLLAKKNTAIFNRESERDWPLRQANFPRFLVEGDTSAFKKVVQALKDGMAALHGTGHKYITPPTEGATIATEVLKDKRTDFYVNAFREYGDSAKVRTATEVRQDVAAGAQAYLTHLASGLDEAETWAMRTATQSHFPQKPDLWFVPRAQRSTNYLPSDQETVIDRAIKRAFGDKPVPLGHTGRVETAKMVAEWMGIGANEDEIEAAVTVQGLVEVMASGAALAIPAEGRALAVVKLLMAAGLVSPDDEEELEGGGKRNLLEALKDAATVLAQADDLARRRESEFIPGGPPPPEPPPEPEPEPEE